MKKDVAVGRYKGSDSKTKNDFTIYLIDDVRENKVVERFLHRMYTELEETEDAGHDFRITWTSGLYATDNKSGKIIGIITFTTGSNIDYSWIGVSAVDKEYRNKGVYKALYQCLKDHIASKGWAGIRSGIAHTNVPMIMAAEKTGRKATGIIFDWKNPRL